MQQTQSRTIASQPSTLPEFDALWVERRIAWLFWRGRLGMDALVCVFYVRSITDIELLSSLRPSIPLFAGNLPLLTGGNK